ncbi:MAG: glycosyltransferase family 2 protein [Candidatus Bathyarchaeota archaeon]|nr:glycosyltransferase family 2 protein [Candidatus Bathyarchaeota archaeon]
MEISIVLPAYNEASRIKGSIREVKRAVSKLTGSFEIIVVEDGSTDGTADIVTELSKNDSHLQLLHSETRLGKGKAVKKGLGSATGDVVVFMDVDLATSLTFLPQVVELAKARRALVVGSRHVKGSRVQRSFMRTLSSLSYNLLVRLLFQDGVHDHQCGFKAMRREVAQFLRDSVESNGFFLDTEMILRCKMQGIPVVEVGVDWVEVRKKNAAGVRLFRDSLKLGLALLRFRLYTNRI